MEGDIVVLQLRQHCSSLVELDSQCTPASFTTDLLYKTCLACLERLGALSASDRRKRFPAALPAATASRFAVAQSLVSVLGTAGYQMGYDALVYPAEDSTRQLLAWFVSELSRAAEEEASRQHRRDDDESVATALQRGVVSLQRLVSDTESKKGQLSCMAPRQRRLRRVSGSAAYVAVGVTCFDDGDTTDTAPSTMIQQINRQFKATVAKIPIFSGDVPKPSLAELRRMSVAERTAVLMSGTKGFLKRVHSELGDGRDVRGEAEGTSLFEGAPVDAAANTLLEKRSGRRATDGGSSLFYNTTEAGLADSVGALAAKRAKAAAEEAEMSAAVASVEATQQSVAKREAQRAEEAAELKSKMHDAKRTLRELKRELADAQRELDEARGAAAALKGDLKKREEEGLARYAEAQELQQLLSLMDDAEGSEVLIRQRITAIKEQRKVLKEDVQAKLAKIEKKREKVAEDSAAAGEGREEQIADLRQQIKAARAKIKARGKDISALQRDLEKCPKDIDRASFLRLIFDMTANIRKQHSQLERVKVDMAEVSRTISQVESRIRDLFVSLEERVYASASAAGNDEKAAKGGSGKKDPLAASTSSSDKSVTITDDFARQAYRNLVDLRSSYTELVSTIQARGVARQELHEIEETSGKLKRVVGGYDLKQMQSDLAALEAENASLKTAARSAS